MWDEIYYPFPNPTGVAVEVWALLSMYIITLPMLWLNLIHVSKGAPDFAGFGDLLLPKYDALIFWLFVR